MCGVCPHSDLFSSTYPVSFKSSSGKAVRDARDSNERVLLTTPVDFKTHFVVKLGQNVLVHLSF